MIRTTLVLCVLPVVTLAFDDDAIKRKCDADWGTDFQMVAYCRDQQREAGAEVDRIRAKAAENAAIATILGKCDSDWGTDYTMVSYCFEQQSDALRELSDKPSDIPEGVAEKILADCEASWGTDFQMIAYCRDQQTTAWKSLQ